MSYITGGYNALKILKQVNVFSVRVDQNDIEIILNFEKSFLQNKMYCSHQIL